MASPLSSLYHRLGFPVSDFLRRHSDLVRGPFYLAARIHRRRHASVPLVLVTGSSGKTTTRALIAHVLARRYEVVETRDNDNIDFHMHRYVLRARQGGNQVLVLEAGIQSRRNARNWSRFLDPDVFVLTNVGDAHLAWLGDRSGVLQAKLEMGRNLRPGGTALLGADDPLLRRARDRWPRVWTFGSSAGADVRAESIRAGPEGLDLEVATPTGPLSVRSPLLGVHQAASVLAAIACGRLFDVPPDEIVEAIAGRPALPRRLEPSRRGGLTILDDSYSANPSSVRAAIDALALFPGRRVLVLADMLDQGESGPRVHREVGRWIAERHPGLLVFLYGPSAVLIRSELLARGFPAVQVEHAPSKLHLLALLERRLGSGDVVLVKGSHGMRMDDVVDRLGRPAWTPVLERFGSIRSVGAFGAYREPERRHAGIDLPTPIGTPVRALAAGVVTAARFERWYGRVVRVRHPGRVDSVYAHLSEIRVRRGQTVEPGDILGRSGRSGIFRTGNDYDYPHLHFETRLDGVPLDPAPWLSREDASEGDGVQSCAKDAPARSESDAAHPADGPEPESAPDG
jgi:UDP-N-acetylmuramoyl-tripeptide--D-alanyl-D-alanine ligase